MLITCFVYIQFFFKWFFWVIQFCGENAVASMFKQFDTPLIRASIAYSAKIIRSLFYLLKKILNLVVSFFSFLGTSFCNIIFVFQDFCFFPVTCFLIFYFILQIFMVSALSIFRLHFRIFLIPCFLLCSIWCSILKHFSFLYCFMDSFLLPYHLLVPIFPFSDYHGIFSF